MVLTAKVERKTCVTCAMVVLCVDFVSGGIVCLWTTQFQSDVVITSAFISCDVFVATWKFHKKN